MTSDQNTASPGQVMSAEEARQKLHTALDQLAFYAHERNAIPRIVSAIEELIRASATDNGRMRG